MKKIKQELTEKQKKALSDLNKCISPEEVRWLRFETIEIVYVMHIDQDTLPVIRAYLDLVEEAMN